MPKHLCGAIRSQMPCENDAHELWSQRHPCGSIARENTYKTKLELNKEVGGGILDLHTLLHVLLHTLLHTLRTYQPRIQNVAQNN